MSRDLMRMLLGLAGIVSLGMCLGSSIAFFQGSIDAGAFKSLFATTSIIWFLVAGMYASRR